MGRLQELLSELTRQDKTWQAIRWHIENHKTRKDRACYKTCNKTKQTLSKGQIAKEKETNFTVQENTTDKAGQEKQARKLQDAQAEKLTS